MARIIKYRGWDVEAQKYNYNIAVGWHSQNGVGAGSDVVEIFDGDSEIITDQGLIIEEFTGLLSTRGVDIYEGDVVRNRVFLGDLVEPQFANYEVVRNVKTACFEYLNILTDGRGHRGGISLGNAFILDTLIVGSIRTNPELIGGAR